MCSSPGPTIAITALRWSIQTPAFSVIAFYLASKEPHSSMRATQGLAIQHRPTHAVETTYRPCGRLGYGDRLTTWTRQLGSGYHEWRAWRSRLRMQLAHCEFVFGTRVSSPW